MPLRTLLYRCPRCGQDPVEGRKDRVRCPSCGSVFRRMGSRRGIRVEAPEEKPNEVLASRLLEAIAVRGGPLPAARDEDGRIDYRARVSVRRAGGEEVIRHGGEVLGFVESFGPPRAGVLRVTDEALELTRDEVPRARWNLMDLQAVQASSSSLQIYTAARDLVQFRFESDSALRWQELLHAVLRKAYREAGRSEIVEFQPRISTR